MKTTVPSGGVVSIPAKVVEELDLQPGETMTWERISKTEFRLLVERDLAIPVTPDPVAALGFGQKVGLADGMTEHWMRRLREGESE